MNLPNDKELARLLYAGAARRGAEGSPDGRLARALESDNRRWAQRRAHAAWRRRTTAAALLLALSVGLPAVLRLAAPYGNVVTHADPREAYNAVCYLLENQNPTVA